MKKVGFWYSEEDRRQPIPRSNYGDNWPGKAEWCAALAMLELRMHNSQKEAVPLGSIVPEKRSHNCKVCGVSLDDRHFVLDGFTWPEHYSHYLQEHNIAPDPAFKQFIIDWAAAHIVISGEPFLIQQ